MKIAIIGKVNQDLPFEEWVNKLQANVEVLPVSQFNITIGNGILNRYVRQYAQLMGINVTEYASDYKSYGDEANLIRNLTLVNNSDLVIGFMPAGSSKESWIFCPGISNEIKAKVITY